MAQGRHKGRAAVVSKKDDFLSGPTGELLEHFSGFGGMKVATMCKEGL